MQSGCSNSFCETVGTLINAKMAVQEVRDGERPEKDTPHELLEFCCQEKESGGEEEGPEAEPTPATHHS